MGYEDSGTGFKITSSGFITHSAPLEREQIFPFGIYLDLLSLLGKCPM